MASPTVGRLGILIGTIDMQSGGSRYYCKRENLDMLNCIYFYYQNELT